MLCLTRTEQDRVYIGSRIMVEVRGIHSDFVVIRFNFWDQDLPDNVHALIADPTQRRSLECRLDQFIRLARDGSAGVMVREIKAGARRISLGVKAPKDVAIERGELRQKRHRRVAA